MARVMLRAAVGLSTLAMLLPEVLHSLWNSTQQRGTRTGWICSKRSEKGARHSTIMGNATISGAHLTRSGEVILMGSSQIGGRAAAVCTARTLGCRISAVCIALALPCRVGMCRRYEVWRMPGLAGMDTSSCQNVMHSPSRNTGGRASCCGWVQRQERHLFC